MSENPAERSRPCYGASVLNAEPLGYSERAIGAWRKAGYNYRETSWAEIDEKIFPDVQGLIVRLARYIDSCTLDRFPDLEFIVSATTGHDHIDEETLSAHGVRLYTLRPHVRFLETIPSTAEHTWALLMALLRRIPSATEDVRGGFWDRDAHRGHQLRGKTIGLIGLGRTGKRVARYADAFDMRVLYFDPFVSAEGDYLRTFSLDSLLGEADIVSLHVHLKPETKNLLNEENLPKVKHGAYFVNTSRGGVWNESVVAALLQKGRIAGVATDVLSSELSNVRTSPLWRAQRAGSNVIITPHIAGATREAMSACEEFIADHVIEAEAPGT